MNLNPTATERKPVRWLNSDWVSNCFWASLLAIVLGILLHESLFGGKGLVAADGVLKFPPWNQNAKPSNELLSDQYCTFLPQQEFTHQWLMRGDFPLWDPYLDCGKPNLASIQGALLFPIHLLLAPLDAFHASGPAAFLKLFCAGLFMMLYLRALDASRPAAFISALAFSLCGFMIVWLGHPHVNCAMWLPLVFYFIEKSFCPETEIDWRKSLFAWIGFAVAFGCMLLGGHPPTQVHIAIAVAIYFGFRLWEQRRSKPLLRVALFAGSVLLGIFLAAPQILPYIEYYRLSSSAVATASVGRWSDHLDFQSLFHFLLPNVSGNPSSGFEDMPALLGWHEVANFNERTAYVGIVPLFLVACSLIRRCRFTKFYWGLILGSLLFICGVPPFPALARLLPIVGGINQSRLLLFVAFSLAVLAGLGWDATVKRESHRHFAKLGIGFLMFAGIVWLWFWLSTRTQFSLLDTAHRGFLTRQFLVFLGGLLAVSAIVLLRGKLRNAALVIGIGWTAFDLVWFAYGYNPAIVRDKYYPETPALKWLANDSSLFRVFGFGPMLVPNSAEVFGISDVRGCDYTTVRRYEELIRGNAGDFFFYRDATNFPPPFQLLNVKYLLAARPVPLRPELFEQVYSNEIVVYQYKQCCDRALIVHDHEVERDSSKVLARVRSPRFDPRKILLLDHEPEIPVADKITAPATNFTAAVRVTAYASDEISIQAKLPRPGFLLLLDTYFPGWIATVNGARTEIHRADYNFRAIALPAGESAVEFRYQPVGLRVGIFLCAGSVIAIAFVLLWLKYNRIAH